MAQDIRELLKQDTHVSSERIRKGHQDRFLARLNEQLPIENPKKSTKYTWLKVAASVAIIVSISLTAFNQFGSSQNTNDGVVGLDKDKIKDATVLVEKQSSVLADYSPQYKETENAFLTNVKYRLSKIEVTDDNRELVESFMVRLKDLHEEYQRLNKELMEEGPSMQSIQAMKDNLEMRITLLNRLENKLKEQEDIENDNYNEIHV
ncbi:hypothetical protein HN014_13740 [Aquimarina sp. TRL1]|uniref:hypothetical protein n=1 Tax=Aquimarina sp. (strain TRL1) TaxID=2736252 RepID=UPI00158BD04F|nr:hypothetical protein [Aquimarina sp. TRL1]QKX05922.1 hypothetical protein HN014_13740 [Aquimarina sp. TRL1]